MTRRRWQRRHRDERAGVEALYLPPFAILKNGLLQVSVQSALAGSMADELGEFVPRPFEDTVYIASRLTANIGVARAERSAGNTPTNSGRITSDLAALVSRQRPDGGWPWCIEPMCLSDPNVTAWVLLALGEARRGGLTFDESGIGRAGTYLSGYINRTADVAHPADPNQKAFMLAAIASADSSRSAISPARALFEQYRAQLNTWGRAYLAMALVDAGMEPDDDQVRALLNDIAAATIPSANGNHWEDPPVRGMFMTNTATTALVTLALARIHDCVLRDDALRHRVVGLEQRAGGLSHHGAGQASHLVDQAVDLSEFFIERGNGVCAHGPVLGLRHVAQPAAQPKRPVM